mmetsp:Transcript_96791/g.153229  ORF Transcript_96791/g.153229 Transcript_96791/m.153229 type:complete len:435 (+) Transcript_96791:107-1411(+)
MDRSQAASNLTKKFDFLQERAQRRPIRDESISLARGDAAAKKANISQLKEFYLQRLTKNEPQVAARLSAQMQKQSASENVRADPAQPEASGQRLSARPNLPVCLPVGSAPDTEDLEIMCNNCFTLIKMSEVDAHTQFCYKEAGDSRLDSKGQIQMLDMKLQKLRAALESRLQDASSKVNVMRHLTQLRYHIDTAVKWFPGCSEIGALSDHTVQQVKQLTSTSRVLAPAVYIFSKRIENVVVQKERELRKAMIQASAVKTSNTFEGGIPFDIDREPCESVADVNSIVSEMDSDTGTQYADTIVTQDKNALGTTDVGNVQDANDYLSLKDEDEQRRWFYSQCLTAKLACSDKARARKTLISDLYAKVREEKIPIDNWVQWIRQELAVDGSPEKGDNTESRLDSLQKTTLVPNLNQASAGGSLMGGYPQQRRPFQGS